MKRLLLLTLNLALLLPAITKADVDTFYTHDFPQPDRAEVIATNSPTETDGPVVKLKAVKARKLAKMLRAQKWTGLASNCDKCQYVLHFYSGHKLIAGDAICFNCGCFAPMHSDIHSAANPGSFDFEGSESRALEAFLAKLFPDAK